MSGTLRQLAVTIRLYFRDPMAMLYGYLFPTIFLVAFWVLYRYEEVPLARHMGELLTVTALGGACFGLPTALVSERERGIWRRYRLAPVSTAALVASTMAARYLLLLTAGMLQLALAMGIGMPLPRHPLELWVAFTLVAFAFLGLGLVIAALADGVPAVQALGQSIFLPMLIIGGVAVRLESLPAWAQHLSAFFPGRYAVQALQACVTGDGLAAVRFSLLALLLIGAAACVAGARMFRWDARQRWTAGGGWGWVAAALAAWVAVGVLAEWQGRVVAGRVTATVADPVIADVAVAPPPRADTAAPVPASGPGEAAPPAGPAGEPAASSPHPGAPSGEAAAPAEAVEAVPAGPPATWQAVTRAHVDQLDFTRLPPDEGVVAPIARPADRPPSPRLARQVECVRRALPQWGPGRVADPVQRVRNLLFVAVVPDIFQMESLEPWIPRVVLARLREEIPDEQLIRILYWIATHPEQGAHAAAARVAEACVDTGGRPLEVELLRERTPILAMKLLGRLTGRIREG